jgi:DegV family protein with EDD domain
VADGDTGTNMVATLNNIATEAQNCRDTSLESVSYVIAESALDGARGNSGTILAQFFQGLAEHTRGNHRMTTSSFAQAAAKAVEKAKNALTNPVEGTILTVMKDWANHLTDHSSATHDFVELLRDSLSKAKKSLADTPNKLKVLKKAGVVDAGAQGFVHMIEGIVEFIESGKIVALSTTARVADKVRHFRLQKIRQKLVFKFCTESLVEGPNINTEKIKSELASLGDSLIVVGSPQKVKIHIHTNEPDRVFSVASRYGHLVRRKVENMKKQHGRLDKPDSPQRIALVTDSTCDLPEEMFEKLNIHIIPVIVQVGNKSLLDRVELPIDEFYRLLKNSDEHLTTSQPPPSSFRALYSRLEKDHDAILSLHISGKLSGTFNGALMAANEFAGRTPIQVFDTKTTSAALGLVVAETARLIKEDINHDEILVKLKSMIEKVRIFVAVPTLKYIIRSGRVAKTKGLLANLFNIRPVITLDTDGAATDAARVFGRQNVFRKTLELACNFASKSKSPHFSVVHVQAPNLATFFRDHLAKRFHADNIFITDASPALGLHVGIGSAAIAVLADY